MTVDKIQDATLIKSNPQTAVRRINCQSLGGVLMPECGPGHRFDPMVGVQRNQAYILVRDPDISGRIVGDSINCPARNSLLRHEPVFVEVPEFVQGGNPDSTPTVLEER